MKLRLRQPSPILENSNDFCTPFIDASLSRHVLHQLVFSSPQSAHYHCHTSVLLSHWSFLLQLSPSPGVGVTASIEYLALPYLVSSCCISGLWCQPVRCPGVFPVPGSEARGEMCLSAQADLREVETEAKMQECEAECLQETLSSRP